MAKLNFVECDGGKFDSSVINSDIYFELGLRFSSGREVDVDLVSAHKWFNLAVSAGNHDAIPHRRELAEQMSAKEIACAQRAAREHLILH